MDRAGINALFNQSDLVCGSIVYVIVDRPYIQGLFMEWKLLHIFITNVYIVLRYMWYIVFESIISSML